MYKLNVEKTIKLVSNVKLNPSDKIKDLSRKVVTNKIGVLVGFWMVFDIFLFI
jgi:hypothetical protein